MRNRDTGALGAKVPCLTKREYAAIAAMQGMMRMETSESDPGKLAEYAVRQADALFDELDKGGDDA